MKNSGLIKRIAEERINILYGLARESYLEGGTDLSRRYVRLIRQISEHYHIRLGRKFKRNICKKCNSILIPGANLKTKLASSKRLVIYICRDCGTEYRIPY